jgi:short-subunit dehydrogenase
MLRRNRGRILNTASVAGFEPGPLLATYFATKAFVLSGSEALATELGETGSRPPRSTLPSPTLTFSKSGRGKQKGHESIMEGRERCFGIQSFR